MAAVPFGFSAGDFVAGLGLLNKAARALRSTSGATSSYQQAILDLELIERVLRQVQGLSPVTSNVETIRAVQLCSLTCHVPLDHFWRKIKKLEPYMTFEETSNQPLQERFVAGIRKLQWAIALEEDVKQLKSSISTGLGTISTLLQFEGLERGGVAHEDATQTLQLAQRSTSMLKRIESTLNDNVVTPKQLDSAVTTLASAQKRFPSVIAALVVDELAKSSNGVSANQFMTATEFQIDTIISLLKNLQSRQDGESLASQARDQDIVELRRFAAESRRVLASLSERVVPGNALAASPPMDGSAWISQDRLNSYYQSVNLSSQTVGNVLYESMKAMLSVFLLVGPMLQAYIHPLGAIVRYPRICVDKKITFVDALDREYSLDYEHFCHWSVLLALLQVRFKGLPGEKLIADNQFALLVQPERAGKGTLIHDRQWNNSIFPGCRVVMSMLLDRQPHDTAACVSCGSETWYEVGAPLWLLCARCGRNYRTLGGHTFSTDFIITPFPRDTPKLLELNEQPLMLCSNSLKTRSTSMGATDETIMMDTFRDHAFRNALEPEHFLKRNLDKEVDNGWFPNMRRSCTATSHEFAYGSLK